MSIQTNLSLSSQKSAALGGIVDVPGDKSMSHRSLILGSLAIGTTKVTGLLEGADVLATADAMSALGSDIERLDDGTWVIVGQGLHGLEAPEKALDLGNSGTGVRLLMGVVASQPITATFTGDASLSVRPMARITDPLQQMGTLVSSRDGGLLPVTITGQNEPMAISYESPVASAQIKSAILLAGLTARGDTEIIEPHASRDHTESMLRHFGATVEQTVHEDGTHHVRLHAGAQLIAADITVPRDPSSAAFPMVAALLTKDSDITLPAIGMNPLRTGLITTLIEMGGDITMLNTRDEGGEPVADLRIRHSDLHGIEIPAVRAASMIDEFPILSVAATQAEGTTIMNGVAELRVKETDRIKVMADGLVAAGAIVSYDDETMTVTGCPIAGGITVDSQHDHRIAMSFLTLGLVADAPVNVDGCETINTSFPNFATIMQNAGANIAIINP
ncbi:MAG: 3-phosphoshikimate 1-carboxyvinyltransferase [Candidatus Puniceispirillum sp.]|uniref:3-phosphoshikimate 1-carboxyvinyltransferase n=1 Tax=Candidatus Puniceispirillum sp. TaxID=2026719 RepID=UPI001EC05045|nr:3-phosphoshikimate 1-carboxyvinyltransferase [Candidatus Puniceispirillum sp.]MBT6414649.1 3-phosphoshikimate 1-carboxyvinyltransferase [Candidatus Puniceispirillum sp.]MBT6566173.1 3-phosphoshikimate 1-carboxyvinyltransferase [Candidatus Puniceispirillum sp.]